MATYYDRPKWLAGTTLRVATGCGWLYITLNYDEHGDLVEIFATLGKAGNCAKSFLEALTRSITLGIKFGVPVEELAKELREIRCPLSVWDEGIQIHSCADGIGRALETA